MPSLKNMQRVLTVALPMALMMVTGASVAEPQERKPDPLLEKYKQTNDILNDDLEKKLHGDPKELSSYVVAVFYGMYYSNTVARSDYCNKQGVPITTYLKVYKDATSADLAAAEKLNGDDKDYEARVHAAIGSKMVVTAARVMQHMADVRQITPQGLCSFFEENAERIVMSERFAARAPKYSKVLRELAAKAP